ncbi:type III-B CRISPR module-associated protein Cmr5 [Clostridium tagluense]|uniref:type III-B CRISPR module-associated protein Cmr5 n=1 Tax=Clostridium tagluense TaxID=360422 RepID=UPI001C0C3A81|nr:type III-B CRISPR module-associated protein Cmr5 [Clostridium tagluense]MBU3127899.1 type III-B CRISPR module-associated protein Cmr5 [Clostridium tagluense]
MSNLKNINLQVSSFAMECVRNVKLEEEKEEETKKKAKINNEKDSNGISASKYKTLVKKMSTLIQKNGFIGTLVFNLSKVNNKEHYEVLKNIINWNIANFKIKDIKEFEKKNIRFDGNNSIKEMEVITKYIEWITSLEQNEYRLVSKEMMNLFGWIKRFADGIIEGKE